MFYQEINPAASLRPYLLNYWLFRVPASENAPLTPLQHTAPPDGSVSLLLLYNQALGFRKALLIGPCTTIARSVVYPASVALGIRVVPGMSEAVFGISAKNLRNTVMEGTELLPKLGLRELSENLPLAFSDFPHLDRLLQQTVPLQAQATDQIVQKVVADIMKSSGQTAISDIKAAAGLGQRQLQKRFLQCVGLSMKELAGICKFRATVIDLLVRERELFDTLFHKGYYDQAHFLHHLKKLSKGSPAAFREHVRQIEHQGVESYAEIIQNRP